jgi:uncharacterized alpha-E superfamily protein
MSALLRALFPAPRKQAQTPAEAEHLLLDRSTAEIAARLLRRAELHDKGNDYLRRCAALDRVAAENMRRLELRAGTDMGEWLERRDLCLRLLREGKN